MASHRSALACLALAVAGVAHPCRAGPQAPCDGCQLLIGAGTTFGSALSNLGPTDGLVLQVSLELDESRWEIGAFRFASAQRVPGYPASVRAADPYWGFTAMRRWQVIHRGAARLYLGCGANYRTEVDYLESTHWNFAYVLALRYDLAGGRSALELAVRHWSDAWIRPPNRGQNFLTLSVALGGGRE
jgi:hypothetical protein